MDIYASILLYICVFAASAVIVQYGYKRKSKALQIIGLLIPVIVGALRYDVGLDYSSYLSAYADITNPQALLRYDGTPELEFTFQVLAQISHFIFSSPIPLFFIYCTITVFAFYAALRLMSPKNVGFALFFFYAIFFLNSFNIMRQGAAMSIGALALVHYIKGEKRKAFIYIFVASLFHISALLIVLYIVIEYLMKKRYLVQRKIKKFSGLFRNTLVLSAGIAIAGLMVSAIGNFIYNITGRIGSFDTEISIGVIFKYLLTIACLYVVIYAWSNFQELQKRLTLFVVLGVIVYALGIIHNESARLGMYLIVLTPILTAVTYDHLKLQKFKSRIFMSIGMVCLSALYIVSVHVGGGEGVRYNYQSVLTSEEYKLRVKEMNS